jgi:ribosome-associated toxin RatA of RatAB toxin-antitoxin module
MRSTIGISVSAPATTVFELARQVERWPELLPHYRSVTVRSRDATAIVADMRAVRRFGPVAIPVAWRSRTWSEATDADDLRLRFVHVGGPTKGMDVTWHIRPTSGASCSASIEHDFTRHLPLLGDELFPRIVDRWFVRPIAGRTLASFKKLAEK